MSSLPHATLAFIKQHLLGLEANLKGYFLLFNRNKTWIRIPFSVNIEPETDLLDLNIVIN